MISDCHVYAVLGTTVENGHRLFHLGSNSTLKWNGKWSEKPGYDEGTLSKLSVQDRQLSDKKTFWIGIDDFVMFFNTFYIGELREGWKEFRMIETVKRRAGDPVQILRLHIKERCTLVIEADIRNMRKKYEDEELQYPLFLNIHHSNSSNECGELIHTSHRYDSQISSDIIHLDSGTYLVVLTAIGSNGDEQENNWVIRSPMPFEEQGSSSFSFVICPQMILLDSVQKVLMKYGKAEQCDKNNVIIYKWHGKQTGIVMVDNRNEWNWLRVNADQQPTVAIISCLFVEKQAVDALIEESSTIHKYKSGGESNVYTLGRIGTHRVVATKLALIGDSREAITSAGSITTRLLGNFQNIEHVFIVGVGGAVPHFTDASLHARLGDVIVSASRPYQYVYAHDSLFDRLTEQITGFNVRNWAAEDKTIEKIVESGGQELVDSWNTVTEEAIRRLSSTAGDVEWKAPPESTDVLAMAVSKGNVVVMPHPNADRETGAEIHLGTVGAMSAMKKYEKTIGEGEEDALGQIRESFAEEFGIRCMDAGFDSVVGAVVGSCVRSWALIRGISDYHYGQSRAGKLWQAHAAARAAGMARCIIEKLPKSA
uniref:Calpain catalytic domain-containing protein n=1 Tax=Caenorhabditis tropicalis TaxID=1561998 RepID=A0A1I7UMB6_9PELO